jgi:phospholipid/cholesterol/gamma-HCH transport system substrate-binding protein
MNDSPNKRAVSVGIFVFAGLIFLLLGILSIGNLNETFKKKMEVVVLFDDVSGLQTGNNIWFSGVKIGTVSSLQFFSQNKVKVMMKVENKAQQYIHKDAFVKISTDGLIGNKILIIYGGTARTPQVEEGDTLAVEKTFTSEDMINTFQDNNKNLLAITNDFKIISNKLSHGEGTVGKFLTDDAIFMHLDATTLSLQNASAKADKLLGAMSTFAEGLNKKGSLANELTTDTVVFQSLKASIINLQRTTDSASSLLSTLNAAGKNRNSAIGVLLHDEESGKSLKQTIKNLESSSHKLDEDLEAAQHNFLLRGYFKQKNTNKSDKDSTK